MIEQVIIEELEKSIEEVKEEILEKQEMLDKLVCVDDKIYS